jgi:hypothetical protein
MKFFNHFKLSYSKVQTFKEQTLTDLIQYNEQKTVCSWVLTIFLTKDGT